MFHEKTKTPGQGYQSISPTTRWIRMGGGLLINITLLALERTRRTETLHGRTTNMSKHGPFSLLSTTCE